MLLTLQMFIFIAPDEVTCCMKFKSHGYLCGLVLLLVTVMVITTSTAIGLIVTGSTATTTIPSVTSSFTVFKAQSNPVTVLLASFSDVNYSTFIVTAKIEDSAVSAIIWVSQLIQPMSNNYCEKFTLKDGATKNHLYALQGSIFEIVFSSLTGPEDGNVTVEYRRFVGSTSTGTCLASRSVVPSTKSQLINYTTLEDGFIEIRVINGGLKGSFEYNFTVNELNSLSLERSQYRCALNLTNRICQHMTVYNPSYLLALVTLDNENPQVHPAFNVTLKGESKQDMSRMTTLVSTGAAFLFLTLMVMILVLATSILLVHKQNVTV